MIARSGRVEINGHLESRLARHRVPGRADDADDQSPRRAGVLLARRRQLGVPARHDDADRLPQGTRQRRTLEFEVTEVIGIHDDHDLALLRVERRLVRRAGRCPTRCPSRHASPRLFERDVYVVGYPAWDGRRNEPEPIRRIFTDIYNVKRLQPGRSRRVLDRLLRHRARLLHARRELWLAGRRPGDPSGDRPAFRRAVRNGELRRAALDARGRSAAQEGRPQLSIAAR